MIRLMEMVKYRHIRPYTKIEMRRITDDYLRNNKYKEVMPDFLKDKDDVLTKLQKIDQLEFLSDKELSRLNNSKVPNMKATTKEPGHSMQTDSFNWKDIVDGIKSVPPKKFAPPLVVQDKKGNLFVIDGDDVLTTFVAIGSNIPVKKVKYNGEFNQESMTMYNKAHMNDMSPTAGSIGATW
tara:strand:+ start:1469 stop:2011 length:543 start_codon:yes stop_codon:yes gene_type:complete